jgi:hypothetical protein
MPRTGPWWKGMRKRESVILTRRRGDAEISAEKRRSQREDERGDSGGWWPSARSGRGHARYQHLRLCAEPRWQAGAGSRAGVYRDERQGHPAPGRVRRDQDHSSGGFPGNGPIPRSGSLPRAR